MKISIQLYRIFLPRFSSNSEALLENHEEMFPRNYIHSYMFSMFKLHTSLLSAVGERVNLCNSVETILTLFE